MLAPTLFRPTASKSSISLSLVLSTGCKPATEPVAFTPPTPAAPNPDSSLAGAIVYALLGDLWVYTPSNRQSNRVGVRGVNPKFSPDGTKIVFQSSTLGIGIMESNGSNARSLNSWGGTPSFDPTGQTIAFGDINSGIWKIGVDGTGLVQLTVDRGIQPSWSPDGSQIAYNAPVNSVGQQLFIMNADGSNIRRALTSKPIIDVVWGPTGKILFGLLVEDFNYELHSFDPNDASSLTRLTTQTENDFEPSWSPDGQHISWSNIATGLWIMNADGSGQHGVVSGGRQGSWGK